MRTKCFEPLQKLRARVWIQQKCLSFPEPRPHSDLLLTVPRRYFGNDSSLMFCCLLVCGMLGRWPLLLLLALLPVIFRNKKIENR